MAHILLVDDDTNVLLTLAIALRRQKHDVAVAQSGWKALELLHRQTFDFLISDVSMPGMTGIELAQRVQKMSNSPIVILTSALDVETSETVANHFMPKPVDVVQLNEMLIADLATHNHIIRMSDKTAH
jgi:DNA-binding response OmpR family regulator